jgi:antitoxin HicB
MAVFPYSIIVCPDADDGCFYAYVPDLPGCIGDGETPEEAVTDAISASKSWIEVQKELGRDIPAPTAKWAPLDFLRLPKART